MRGWQCKASPVTVQPFKTRLFSAASVAATSSPPGACRVASESRVSASHTLTISGGMQLRAAAVIDGEVIAADADGRPNFSALQDDLKRGRHHRMVYYAFDLLHLDGSDTRAAPL